MIASSAARWHPAARFTATAGEAAAVALAACIAAASVLVLGFYSLAVAFYVLALVWAVLAPRTFAVALLFMLIAFEVDPIDFTQPIGNFLWKFPPLMQQAIPVTSTPFDYLLLATALSLAMRPREINVQRLHLPGLLWAVPAVLALGYVYGVYLKGGPSNIAYVEMRGLLIGGVAFYVALRLRTIPLSWLHRAVFAGTSTLAIVVIARYFVYVRGQETTITGQQFIFEHADVLILGVGAVYGVAMLLRTRPTSERLLLVAYQLLMIAGVVSTGRRSGTLVLAIALLIIIALLLLRTPMLTIWLSSLLVIVAGVYVASYWNQEFGATAQPARAIRSQFDPSLRDRSSDSYRDIERFNVVQTIRVTSPIFGIGAGNSFARFIPLPGLPWWPFQFVTPHDNILWIWLKYGIAGVGVLLGVWVLALRRCFVAFMSAPRAGPLPIVPLAVAASLVMFFGFAQVDIMLVSPRGTIPLAILLAAAFSLPVAGGTMSPREVARSVGR